MPPPPGFRIETTALPNGVQVVRPSGDLDAHSTDSFMEELDRCLERKQYRILVDFSGVPYMSSSGAGALIALNARTQEGGGKMVVCGVQPPVAEVLDMLGLNAEFPVMRTRAEAEAQFKTR